MDEPAKELPRSSLALLFLWVSILIFSAANSVIAKLGQLGAEHLVDGRNPISFCNVLFAANIIAGLTLLAIHRKSWNKQTLSQVRRIDWLNMLFIAIISGFLGPSLFFIGLMLTKVINVVLISTIDIPLTLILAWIILRERPSIVTVVAALFAICGIIITFLLHPIDPMSESMKMTMVNIGDGPVARFLSTTPKMGEVCIAIATFFTVFSVEYGRKMLKSIPIGIFSVFRMIVGAVIFFFVVIAMLGWVHFIDIFDPFLLEWMAVYGIGIVALGLYLWYKGMQGTRASDLAAANSCQPITGIIFAYLILGEIPHYGQIIGGAIILVGIAIALIGKLREERLRKQQIGMRKPQSFSGV